MYMASEELDRRVQGQTLVTRFLDTVGERADKVAVRSKRADGTWWELTWSDLGSKVAELAHGLVQLGIQRDDRVALLMRNRPEFFICDLAVLFAGCTPISVYNSSSPAQIQYLLREAGATAVIVEDPVYLYRVIEVHKELPELEHIILLEDPDGRAPSGVVHYADFFGAGSLDLVEAASRVQPDDVATIIYTSGTTGPPKGVVLDHANICWTVESLRVPLEGWDPRGRRLVSYLPMAHIAERMVTYYQGVVHGFEVSMCPDAKEVVTYLGAVQPEIFFGVPRVFEKMSAAVHAMVAGDANHASEFQAAIDLGLQAALARLAGTELSSELAGAWKEAESTHLRGVRQLLGLDAAEVAVSGAAPLSAEVFKFFLALGVPISEIYGMSESSGPITWDPFRVKAGTVGRALPGVELKLAPTDHEVMFRGGNVFRGYFNDADKTAEVIDGEGWVHTGDVGELDDEGYLRIVDRKKELIITSSGKNISPANLEMALTAAHLIGQACVIGDRRPYLTALLVLDPDVAPAWAAQRGITFETMEELALHSDVRSEVEREIAAANERFSNIEQVKRFTLMGTEWLADSEELTPTMKLRRRGILKKYEDQIEEMYTR